MLACMFVDRSGIYLNKIYVLLLVHQKLLNESIKFQLKMCDCDNIVFSLIHLFNLIYVFDARIFSWNFNLFFSCHNYHTILRNDVEYH